MSDVPQSEIIYVGDPMCSWCWGISPELDGLIAAFPDIHFRILSGGLRPGPSAEPMTDDFAAFLANEWNEIGARTGQPFDFKILQNEDWLYDTEPACRAVTVMSEIDETLAWPLFKRIQYAFYAEGILVTDPNVYSELVADIGGDPAQFMSIYMTREAVELVLDDFEIVRSWGITSFPTVIFRQVDSGDIIAAGYATAEEMIAAVKELSLSG